MLFISYLPILLAHTDAPEFEFCIVSAKYLIECAAVNPLLAEVRAADQ